MTIRQGFNRLGVSVAIAFLGLSLVCLCFAASNYLQYSSEIELELQRRTQSNTASSADLELVRAAVMNTNDWLRFASGRYRSVDQALDLAALCVLASLLSFIFWNAIGWMFERFGVGDQRSAD